VKKVGGGNRREEWGRNRDLPGSSFVSVEEILVSFSVCFESGDFKKRDILVMVVLQKTLSSSDIKTK
jgi:hypothetical protein